jgi:hypothetical protein
LEKQVVDGPSVYKHPLPEHQNNIMEWELRTSMKEIQMGHYEE